MIIIIVYENNDSERALQCVKYIINLKLQRSIVI